MSSDSINVQIVQPPPGQKIATVAMQRHSPQGVNAIDVAAARPTPISEEEEKTGSHIPSTSTAYRRSASYPQASFRVQRSLSSEAGMGRLFQAKATTPRSEESKAKTGNLNRSSLSEEMSTAKSEYAERKAKEKARWKKQDEAARIARLAKEQQKEIDTHEQRQVKERQHEEHEEKNDAHEQQQPQNQNQQLQQLQQMQLSQHDLPATSVQLIEEDAAVNSGEQNESSGAAGAHSTEWPMVMIDDFYSLYPPLDGWPDAKPDEQVVSVAQSGEEFADQNLELVRATDAAEVAEDDTCVKVKIRSVVESRAGLRRTKSSNFGEPNW